MFRFDKKLKKEDLHSNANGFNLLKIKPIRKLILWKAFPYIFQAVVLILFLSLIYLGWQVYTPEGLNDKLFAKTNMVTLLIWGIWWPLMVWLAVTFGRIWCVVCPLELVSNIFERLGRKVKISQKALPKYIRNGAVIVFIYALIQLLVAGIHLHRIPAYTSFFLVGLLTLSAFVGLMYKDRAFCRGFCPIGMLLNAYGRGGMIGVRAGNSDTCGSCSGQDCISSCNRNNMDSRSCPSLLNPPKLNSNKDCLVCGQCIKSCEPDNMELVLRKPFNVKDVREVRTSWVLTLFIIIVSGFVTYELTTEWKPAKEIFLFVPTFLTQYFNLENISGFIKSVWTIGIFPLLLWILLGLFSKIQKRKIYIFEFWRELALPLVIIISAGHLIKALAKLNSWIVFLPKSIQNTFSNEQLSQSTTIGNLPDPLVSSFFISMTGILILFISLFYSMREEKIFYNRYINSHFIPKMIVFIFFLILVVGIGI